MSKKEIVKLIREHLKRAEADLEKTRRGSNFGRVAALKDLLLEVLEGGEE